MIRSASIQASALDTGDIRHDFELRVQGRPAGATEEMLVHFARSTCGVVGLDLVLAFRHVEIAAWNHDIGSVCRAGPLLTVSAVAEGCGGGLAWRRLVCVDEKSEGAGKREIQRSRTEN